MTPSFNQREYVESTLSSVISQGYSNLEYVVIDGGSTDGSVDVIKRHERRLAHWVSEPDNGLPHALNKGFEKTTGEIMCWINSSDMHYPWTLATVAEIFSDLPQVEWLMGVPTQFNVGDGPKSVSPVFINIYDILAGHYRSIQQESVFWRRSLWERAGGRLDEGLKYAADFELWLRFFRLAPLYHAETILGGFRVHDDRLGDAGRGRYNAQAASLFSGFVAGFDTRDRSRARLVRVIGAGRRKVIGQALHKIGVWPWYSHPRIVYDFERRAWSVA